MNRGSQAENARKLLAYEMEEREDHGARKFTCELSQQYHDILERMSIIQGKTKTAVVRQALDELAKQFGDEILYPRINQRLV